MSTIKVKDSSVNLCGLRPEMQPVLKHGHSIWTRKGFDFVVTSARDGLHSPGSLHYYGFAADFRTWTHNGEQLPLDVKKELVAELKEELRSYSDFYDIIIHTTHIHVEYDWVRKQLS